MNTSTRHPFLRALGGLLGGLVLLGLLTFFLQSGLAHHRPRFQPDHTHDLHSLLLQPSLKPGDYDLIFRETGLSQSAVDELRQEGQEGINTILSTQTGFHAPVEAQCVPIIGGRFTCEDRLVDENGGPLRPVPLAPLQAGDLIVSFSTHTMGWRHGHAGLVTDPGDGETGPSTLEAIQIGVNSRPTDAQHWRDYSNFLVLRVRGAAKALCEQVVRFARQFLDNVPYSLLAGLTGPKLQPAGTGEPISVQCAYLPWRAWMEAGVDLDENGGRVVTVADLARSPLLDVVQVYGMDPAPLVDRQCRV